MGLCEKTHVHDCLDNEIQNNRFKLQTCWAVFKIGTRKQTNLAES